VIDATELGIEQGFLGSGANRTDGAEIKTESDDTLVDCRLVESR
jgi:hypothetical protein